MRESNELIDKPLSVSETNCLIKTIIREKFYNLTIEGEVGSFRPSANGHWYFKLKDEKSQIDAVMFRYANAMSSFVPQEGDKVSVTGSIDVYEARGTYQIIVQSIRKAGLGELLAMLQKRKDYYQSLGWFEKEGKPAIPRLPSNIGVVTATTGAAIKDILDTTGRRAPNVDITIYPTLVQGSQAAEMIASAIRQANDLMISDVLIVGRGGGSVEDLLPFSEDAVIQAIHESQIPVISAVGHEIDSAISDFVASARAITPTDGAIIATEGWAQAREEVGLLARQAAESLSAKAYRAELALVDQERLRSLIERKLASFRPENVDYLKFFMRQKADSLEVRLSYASDSLYSLVYSRLEKTAGIIEDMMEGARDCLSRRLSIMQSQLELSSPAPLASTLYQRIRFNGERLASLKAGLGESQKARLERLELKVASAIREAQALDPAAVLSRGYAIAFDSNGKIIRTPGDTAIGDDIEIRLAKGGILASVTGERK